MEVRFPPGHRTQHLKRPRNLSAREWEVLDFLLRKDFPGRDALLLQVPHTRVAVECRDCATVELVVEEGVERALVEERIPSEAETISGSGSERVHLLLHVTDGRLAEIEVFRFNHEPVHELPGSADLRLAEPPPLLSRE